MKALISVLAAGLLAAGPAAAAANVIAEPDWISKPSGEDFSQAYPPIAIQLEIGGKAIIACKVDAFGKLQACEIEGETPDGMGFGAAALSMAAAFHMRPQSVNGEAVEGGTVRIPIRFVPQRQAEPAPPPTASSPHALELARKLTALNEDETAAQVEGFARQLEAARAANSAFAPIAAALRESYPPRAAQARERSAALVANTFTEDELAMFVAFFCDPTGSAQMVHTDDVRAMEAKFSRVLHNTALTRAREIFCRNSWCLRPGEEPSFVASASALDPAVTISAPVWSQEPSHEVIAQFLPSVAQSLRIPGTVRLICVVAQLGVLSGCTVAGEEPIGLGFAMAAKSLASYYRLSPMLLAEGAVGKSVAVDVRFTTLKDDSAEPLPEIKARSPHAMSLARELIVVQDSGPNVQYAARGVMEEQRKLAVQSGLTPAGFDRLVDALAQGSQAAFEQVQEANAAYLTTQLTDEQLIAATRFWRGPGGRAWKAKRPGLMAQTAAAGVAYGRLVLADAGRAFCKVRDCEGKNLGLPATGPKSPQTPISRSSAPSTRTP